MFYSRKHNKNNEDFKERLRPEKLMEPSSDHQTIKSFNLEIQSFPAFKSFTKVTKNIQ